MNLSDTLRNLVSGLGSSKDKGTSSAFVTRVIPPDELNSLHRSDWMAKKVVDIIPNDMTREWRDWQSGGDTIEAIERVEKSPLINLPFKLNRALQVARLTGGSVIFIGINGDDHSQELVPERIAKDSLKYLHVLSRYEVTCGDIEHDVTSEYYGQPSYYDVVGNNGGTARIHPSRMIRFIGAPFLDENLARSDGWGDSVLQVVYDVIHNSASAQQYTSALIPEAKTDVLYVPRLSEYLRNATTTTQLTNRFTYANTMKSMFNMLLLEGDGENGERWEQKQISFAQLPELIRQFIQIVAGAADIPVTRFLGESPGGLNATGKSDLQNYYDNIKARQRTEMSPALHRLDEVIIRSATGARDESTYYEWAPLWGMSDKEKAEIFKMKADSVRTLVGAGAGEIIPIEAISDAIVNSLIEDGSLPGLEAAIEEYGKLSEQEEDEAELAAAAGLPADPDAPPGAKPAAVPAKAADAAPRTLYVRRDVLNKDDIISWAKAQGFSSVVDDLHVTIVYSKKPVDWIQIGEAWGAEEDGTVTVNAGGPRLVERLGEATVVLFSSSILQWRHEDAIRNGASHDFPDYQPHITISYEAGDLDISKMEPYKGKIVLGPEIFEEIDPDYKNGVLEK